MALAEVVPLRRFSPGNSPGTDLGAAEQAQIASVRSLVWTARGILAWRMEDRDLHSDLPLRHHRYDSFFALPNDRAVLRISSNGNPVQPDRENGLFISAHQKSDMGIVQRRKTLATKRPHQTSSKKMETSYRKG